MSLIEGFLIDPTRRRRKVSVCFLSFIFVTSFYLSFIFSFSFAFILSNRFLGDGTEGNDDKQDREDPFLQFLK